ncbi:MAG TPA: DUF2079 domain-containing protein [Ktedonosporobacter sp.]|nr:DUF2079 domain-containing protein [Ktedonosporobacter sp.]
MQRVKKQGFSRLALTQEQIAWILLALLMLGYAIVMCYETVLRYDTFKATAFDLGNYDQAIWNTLHGRPFQFTNQGDNWFGPPTRLAIHFEPIILPLSLLYVFHADPRILLVFQTLVLTTGALPIFLLTRKYIPAWPLAAPVLAAGYLLSPSQLDLNLFDFHPLTLAAPILLFAVLALCYRRYIWFLIACVLAASCKEDVPLAIALFGLLVIWKFKSPRLGIALIIGGILWTSLAFLLIKHFYPGAQGNNYWYRYEALGSDPGSAIINVLLHPWLLFSTFITIDRFYYLAGLIRSSGFLALLDPLWLIPALFSLAVNLLSTDALLYSGVYQYNAPIVPFVALSSIFGLQRVFILWKEWRGETIEVPLVGQDEPYRTTRKGQVAVPQPVLSWLATVTQSVRTAYMAVVQGVIGHPAFARPAMLVQPRITTLVQASDSQWRRFSERMTPLARLTALPLLQWIVCGWIVAMLALNLLILAPMLNIHWPDHLPGSREQHIQQLLDMIPPDASVSAGGTLNPHLTERQYVTVFPTITIYLSSERINVQYVVVDLNGLFPEDRVNTAHEINQLIQSKQFRLLGRAEGVILLVRR